MSREIKFRAWNGNNMVDLYSTTKFAIDKDLKIDGLFIPFSKDFKLMQFTGLTDKNGKDIYEGDILICHEYDSRDCIQKIVQTFKNAVVGFSQGSYYYYPKGNMKCPHQLLMYAYQAEIIGNIYENPELLK